MDFFKLTVTVLGRTFVLVFGTAMRMEERKRRKERRTRIEIAIGLAIVALLYLLQLI